MPLAVWLNYLVPTGIFCHPLLGGYTSQLVPPATRDGTRAGDGDLAAPRPGRGPADRDPAGQTTGRWDRRNNMNNHDEASESGRPRARDSDDSDYPRRRAASRLLASAAGPGQPQSESVTSRVSRFKSPNFNRAP